MKERKIGLCVSDRCIANISEKKDWSGILAFVEQYWRVLGRSTLLVSRTMADILAPIENRLKEKDPHFRWNLEISDHRRALVGKLVANNSDNVERVLCFLDPYNLSEETESLEVLRQAIAEHGQKLHINYNGAREWAERAAKTDKGLQSRPIIGANDALVFVGSKPGSMVDRFAMKHLEKIIWFRNLILPPHTRETILGLLRALDFQLALSCKTHESIEDITKLLVHNYFDGLSSRLDGRLCHVIACPGPHNPHMNGAIGHLIKRCADPHMIVNLMLDQETAEEWIQQRFEHTQPTGMIQ